jgi:hypothetical protein
VIGTLNEGQLHAQLKEWYRLPGDLVEQPVDGYVIDIVRSVTLIEIQTGGFAPLRRKLNILLDNHHVRLPITRQIVRLSPTGEVLSSRRSPLRGRPQDVFARLVSLPNHRVRPGIDDRQTRPSRRHPRATTTSKTGHRPAPKRPSSARASRTTARPGS